MSAAVETRMTSTQEIEYRKHEIESKSCSVEMYQFVTPETVIGYHFSNRQPVKAGLRGRIATVYFNPTHDSLMIMILAMPSDGHWEPRTSGQ